jgi:hypothetical protein
MEGWHGMLCRVARPRAVAWPCVVMRGSKHGHSLPAWAGNGA